MALDGISPQEYPVDAGVSQSSIQSSRSYTFPTIIISVYNITIDETTLYFKCDQASRVCLNGNN